MGKRSKITQLPAAVKAWLDQALIAGNFAGYQALEADLLARGYAIGKSSIHRYGTNLERKLASIKASTEAARLIAAEAPDDADHRSAAVISMIQTEVFDVLVALQEAGEADPMKRAKLLATVAKNVATLSRASVNQKKHEIEVRERIVKEERERGAKVMDEVAKAQGLSDEQAKFWREKFLGVTTQGA